MNDPVKCMNCGAVSYNEPGKTDLYCGGCYRAPDSRLQEAVKEIKSLRDRSGIGYGSEEGYAKGLEACLSIITNAIPELSEGK